jgi:hypothetical protein
MDVYDKTLKDLDKWGVYLDKKEQKRKVMAKLL